MRTLRAAILAASIIASPATIAQAQSIITVDATSDLALPDGNCEFKEAVQAANTNLAIDACAAGSMGTDKIVFDPALSGQTIAYASAPDFNSGDVIVDARLQPIILQATGAADALQVTGANLTLRGLDVRASSTGNGLTLISGNATIDNSSLVGRLGINAFGTGSLVAIENSTVASTESNPVSDIAVRAGVSTSLSIGNSTIVASVGSGIDVSATSGNAAVYSSIVVGATPINDAGNSTTSGGTLTATSKANAGLAATLANNGGPTLTFALLSGAAIDGGDCTSAAFPRHDQRYYFNPASGARAVGAGCDAGAYESGAQDLLADLLFMDGFEF